MSKNLTFALAAAFLVVGGACTREETPARPEAATTQPAKPGRTADEIKQKVGEAVDAAVSFALRKKEEYQQRADEELQKAEQRIAELRRQARDAAELARPELEKRISNLREQAAHVRERLRNLKDAGAEAWEEAQQGLDTAIEELQKKVGGAQPPATQPVTQPTTQP